MQPNLRLILDAIRKVEARGETEHLVSVRLNAAKALAEQLSQFPAGAHELVIKYGYEVATRELEAATYELEAVRGLKPDEWPVIWELLDRALVQTVGVGAADLFGDRARESMATVAMNIARLDGEMAARVRPSIQKFSVDATADVRSAVSTRLLYLWKSHPQLSWKLAEDFVVNETSSTVLADVFQFLSRVASAAPDRADDLSDAVIHRDVIGLKASDDLVRKALVGR